MSTLSSLLVERKVATVRQVEEALARQVLYGGDFATNLLELARVGEPELLRALGDAYGLTAAVPGELPRASAEALALVAPETAQRHTLYPLALDQGSLVVAVPEPLPPAVEADLVARLGSPLSQVIASAVRVRHAIARDYSMPLDARSTRLVAALDAGALRTSAPPPDASPASAMARLARAPSSTGAFGGRTPTPRPPSVAPVRVPTPTPRPASAAELEAPPPSSPRGRTPTLSGVAAPTSSPPPEPAPTPTPMPAVGARIGSTDAPRANASQPPPELLRSAAAFTASTLARRGQRASRSVEAFVDLVQRGTDRPPRMAAGRRRGPLTRDAAEALLDDVVERDEALGVLFDYARQFFEYAGLFLVHGALAEGRDAWGQGATRDAIAKIGVPLELPSVFATARATRAPVVASLATSGIDAELARDLGRPRGVAAAVVPVVLRERVVALLYGDHGGQPVEREAIEDVVALAPHVAAALERIIVRRKLDRFRAAPTPNDDAKLSTKSVASAKLASAPPKKRAFHDSDPIDEGWANVPTPAVPPVAPVAADADLSPTALASLDAIEASLLAARATDRAPAPSLGDESVAVAVSARPPPAPRHQAHALPRVVVHADLVEAVIAGGPDAEAAFGEIVRIGEPALAAVFARFPGPTTRERWSFDDVSPPAASGPVLRLVAALRRLALPELALAATASSPDTRHWAARLLGELHYAEAAAPIARLLDDDDPHVRRAALESATALARYAASAGAIRGAIEELASSPVEQESRRLAAIESIAALGTTASVPALVELLDESSPALADAAHAALTTLTGHDLGREREAWLAHHRATHGI